MIFFTIDKIINVNNFLKKIQTTLTNTMTETPASARPHKEAKQKELCQSLANWFIADSIPLRFVQSEMFRKFLHNLDPGFVVPDVKLVKQIIHRAYNHTYPLIVEYVENHAISVNLTTDLWTARNRQGYLGVT